MCSLLNQLEWVWFTAIFIPDSKRFQTESIPILRYYSCWRMNQKDVVRWRSYSYNGIGEERKEAMTQWFDDYYFISSLLMVNSIDLRFLVTTETLVYCEECSSELCNLIHGKSHAQSSCKRYLFKDLAFILFPFEMLLTFIIFSF